MLARSLAVLSLLSSVLALPSGCALTLPGQFKLTARNTTLPNSNATGIPLMVADVQSDHEGRTYELCTVASYPYSDIVPTLTLTNGGLEATGPGDYAVGYSLYSGSPVQFVEGLPADPKIAAQSLFCAMPPLNPGGYHRLMVQAVAPNNLFKICPTSFITPVFFNVTQDNPSYGFTLKDCFDVDVLLVPTANITSPKM